VAEKNNASPSPVYRFGVFQANLAARELRKHGVRVRLPGQPFCILSILLEKPGEVITREDIQKKLWTTDTFVDFEHSLNSAVKKLRSALGDTPENSRYIETIPRVGYRFIAPVEEVTAKGDSAANALLATSSFSVPTAVEQSSKRRWKTLIGVSIVLIAAVGAYIQWSNGQFRTRPTTGRVMLAVLPFENLTGDAGQDYFTDGLTEEMISQLGRLNPEHLGVIARTSVMHYKHSQEPLPRIAQELGVQYVLEGTVRRDTDKVRISAQLIQMNDQTHLWARQYDRELSSLLALQGEIAQEVANEIELTLGQLHERVAAGPQLAAPPNSYEAYELYLKGRYFWNKRTKEGFEQAAAYFQQAIARDANYARAYAGLADTFGLMSTWYMVPHSEFIPKARVAALKALQIDDSVAEAHASVALIAENYDYDWMTAEKEFRRAIQLDPGYATAHQWYAEYLSWQGRFDEALAESERARRLDPLSLIIATDLGEILYLSRQYERAIEQSRAVIEMEPTFGHAYSVLITAEVQSGKFADALADIERCRRAVGSNKVAWELQAYIHGRAGRQAEARHALAKLNQSLRPSEPVEMPLLLTAYLGTGQIDEVMALLQRAYSEHSNALTTLKVDPMYDPLRSDPRFQDLLERAGLASGTVAGPAAGQ
jgi:TolB-like protein/DNA-binding winged helix-turn-helix (wHTH) protein/Tfp pilus assembly protein PilF